jgi:hypothetical protein
MSNYVKPKQLKAKITITLEPSLILYAEKLGRSNVSLGVRHALIEYRDNLDLEVRAEKISAQSRASSEGAKGR